VTEPAAPPLRLAVLGVGLIGGSVALAAHERLGAHVTGWDVDPEALAEAFALGVLDAVVSAPEELTAADIVVVAVPVPALESTVRAACAALPEAVITDVGSTKHALVEALGDASRFIGGHPLAGAEVAGVAHARADLFAGSTWYLTPRDGAEGVLYERLHRFVAGLGAVPTAIGHAEHDELMAAFSHLPHLVANALVAEGTLAVQGGGIPATGPSFRDMTRVAGANPPLWAGIYAANRSALLAGLDGMLARLGAVRELVADGDVAALESWQREVAVQRAAFDAERAGGPLREVRAVVPNRPGVVADLARTLARAGINIHDMSLSPAADWRTGEIGVWVAEDQADRARDLIAEVVR
jgi:prephenate dehydrogenase